MNIDWSKAPAWASAVGTVSGGSPAWISDEGYCFHGIANPPCHPYKGKNYTRDSFTIVARRPWTGKGLPPVDTVCIFNTDKVYDEEWHPILPRNEDIEVTIVAHVVQPISGMTVAVFTFQCEGGIQVEMGVVEMFKPKPSAEQIAAEERREAIESLAGELGGHWSEEAKAPHRIMATYLHDIGYRKQVAK